MLTLAPLRYRLQYVPLVLLEKYIHLGTCFCLVTQLNKRQPSSSTPLPTEPTCVHFIQIVKLIINQIK